MKVARGLIIALLLSVGLGTALNAWLPTDSLYPGQRALGQPVFQAIKPVELDHMLIVPFFKQIPLNYEYKRVKIKNNELFIDLVWPEDVPDKRKYDAVYMDAWQLIVSAFTQTSNMDQVFLRFLDQNSPEPDLILAVSCERTEALMTELAKTEEQTVPTEEFLKQFAHLVYGTGWRK
ncbi:hypothetical protein CathTA2_1620 [Caldalkalibacillus thermarum TA2.A1]|uniref:Uncharacterized protein n=1 Tax=Caldalkalibacillus thermarum (strain TA2.A1) TaxID=986075 RepID=F5L720_CALTT|nr:hypothetical protein [Caldalkalibacillus thermarum]EGL82855.1 hypothetical protein CathTA2_1620 [Caldalkalibacillus thermarum TA2.A1]QZT32709.1 hypothetical protein HUR95_09955 [Caldalkalibacillus thermarum TA2.A1]